MKAGACGDSEGIHCCTWKVCIGFLKVKSTALHSFPQSLAHGPSWSFSSRQIRNCLLW